MAKKHKHEEHENHERWLVSYADFITLLFAFFVILYATSQKDLAKQQEVERAITRAFDPMVEFGGLIGKFIDVNDNARIIPPPIPLVPQEGEVTPQRMAMVVEDILTSEMGKDEMKELLEIKHDRAGVRVSLHASGFFDSGSALIKEESLKNLEKVAKILKAANRDLIVEGHTDDQPITSQRYPSNWELSASRATSLVRYLIQYQGIAPSKLAAMAYADQKPVMPNVSEANRARNRRVDILIVMDPQIKP